ncbi:MAG: NeuD/PglB/VioB family sugar acetyltransferase [Patescibacteria group bacterium]|jgi:sugar O-acyltransferase (sialic acid O-acetyltransferase NeuD family)
MLKKIIIVGAGENGQVIVNILKKKYAVSGFLDDSKHGGKIIGKISAYTRLIKGHSFFVNIGNNAVRKRIYLKLKASGAKFVNAIHPLSFVENTAKIGENVFIGAFTYVNVNSQIGDNVFINNGCIIEHDNLISSHAHVAPGVVTGGKVVIGTQSFIGLGSRINDHVSIGNQVTIGSGSVVIKNISNSVTAVGIPARIIKKL